MSSSKSEPPPDPELARRRATQVLSELDRTKSLDAPKRRRKNERPPDRERDRQGALEQIVADAKARLAEWARNNPERDPRAQSETKRQELARRLRNIATTIEFEARKEFTDKELYAKLRDELYAIAAEVEQS